MFDHVVLLTGMPRSGTSWLSQIFDSHPDVRFRLSPLFSYEFKNRLTPESSREEWDAVLRGAYASENEFMAQKKRRDEGDYPVFAAKAGAPRFLVVKDTRFHNLTRRALELLPGLKVIAIVRHPCGAIHSWLTTRGEFPKDADPLREWRTGRCRKTGYGEYWGFDDWKAVTADHLALAREFPERVCLVRYEALVQDPLGEGQRMFAFTGLDFDAQTRDFLAASHARHAANEYAVFKDPAVAWRWMRELQPGIRSAIEQELRGTELERFLA